MDELEQLTLMAGRGESLTSDQSAFAATCLTESGVDARIKKDFLKALAAKGETAEEVASFAAAFRAKAIDPGVDAWAGRAIDVCGTGGDGSSTFNISTAVSFIVAAAGVPVFKHGNRSITSKCGSADLLEAVGIRLDAPHELLRKSIEELNFCFFFAPAFHPAFKEIMPVRKALAEEGQRTIFNLLGPLINPGRPAHQLLGVYSIQWVQPVAAALGALNLSAGLVVHGTPEPGRALDELSCAGSNRVAGFGRLADLEGALPASDAGLPSCEFSELAGGDINTNLEILHALLDNQTDKVPTGLRNTVLLNAGAALWAAGMSDSLRDGIEIADNNLVDGRVAEWLKRTRDFYAKS